MRAKAPAETKVAAKPRVKLNPSKPSKKEYRPGRSARRDLERRGIKNAKKKLSPRKEPIVGKRGKQKAWNSGKHSFNGESFNRKSSPIKIPKFATIVEQIKTGYTQVKYTWTEGGTKFEARWHTKTPGAPAGQGDTWVVMRTTPGTRSTPSQIHILTGKNQWTRIGIWKRAADANAHGTATPDQQQMLHDGHFPAY